jgi:hypothetical protein
VDFYDAFDGWGGIFGFEPEHAFDDLATAQRKCDELQSELGAPNKRMGEHWGVIDGRSMMEVYCGQER